MLKMLDRIRDAVEAIAKKKDFLMLELVMIIALVLVDLFFSAGLAAVMNDIVVFALLTVNVYFMLKEFH